MIVLIGVALAIPRLRRLAADKARPKLRQIWADLKVLAARPFKLVELFGGAIRPADGGSGPRGGAARLRPAALLATIFIVITLASMLGGVSPVPGAWAWWRPG